MKNLLLFLSVIVWASCSQPAENDIAEISAVLNTQAAEWNKGNIEGYMQGYWNNDSLLFIGSKGPVYGYNNTLQRYKKGYPDKDAMGQLSFSNLSFKKLSNEYYHVTGSWSLMRKGDNPNGYFTLIFRKIDGHWVIVADHSS